MAPTPPRKAKLTELLVTRQRQEAKAFLIWDTHQHGLALRVQPTGHRAYKVIYSRNGRSRWLHLGDATAIGLSDARLLAAEVMLKVAKGQDPAAERRAMRTKGTFAELAARYVEEHSKKNNKSLAAGRPVGPALPDPDLGAAPGRDRHPRRRQRE